MVVNAGFSSEDEFDTSVDFDPTFLSELDQAEQQAVPTNANKSFKQLGASSQLTSPYIRPHSSASSVRPGHQVLRPPVPPPPKRVRLTSTGPGPSQSQSTTSHGAAKWVHPNPFIKPEKVGESAVSDEEDDTPMVIIASGGYQLEPSARPQPQPKPQQPQPLQPLHRPPTRPPFAKPIPPPRAVPRGPPTAQPPPRTAPRQASAAPVAAPSRPASAQNALRAASAPAVDLALANELEALRKEKAALLKELEASQAQIKQSTDLVYAKTGEITMVRRRLQKNEDDHAAQRERELQAKRQLEEALKSKDADHKRELERIRVENAFTRQELETSARRPPASQWSSSRQARQASQVPQMPSSSFYGPPRPVHASPSKLPARKREPGTPAPVAGPSMAGFKNSFIGEDDVSPAPAGARRARARSSEQMPPPTLLGRRSARSEPGGAGVETPGRKGKGKGVMLDGIEDDDSVMMDESDSMRVGEDWTGEDHHQPSREGDPFDEFDDQLGRDGGRDWHREITAAVLNHTTITHFDSASSIQPSPATTPRGTFSSGRTILSFPGSRFMLTGNTSTAGAFPSFPSTRLSNSTAAAASAPSAPPTPNGPAPTIRGLTSVRFAPATSTAILKEYEEVCCELFVALGRRDGLDDGVGPLVQGLCQSLISLISLFEREAIIGPLIGTLHLLSSLVLVFPQFTACLLPNDSRSGPGALLAVLAKIVRRFGRPTPPPRQPESAAKAKARERSRKAKGLAARASEAAAVAQEERVVLEPAKRVALLFGAVEVLEGLAWRMTDGQEDSLAGFLASADAVATLLDPHQPTALLTSTVRFLSLVGCRPGLFVALASVKFYDAGDVRATAVPLFDRCGTLLVRASPAGQAALDRAVLGFVTTLLTKRDDATAFVSQSPGLIPELLDKLFRDVRTVWESDGLPASDAVLAQLGVVVGRLAAAVRLFYLVFCGPRSELKVSEFLGKSGYAGLYDRFYVAFGTVGFAGVPEWAEGREEGRVLAELRWVAQECCEDVSPEEMEELAGVWEEEDDEEDEDEDEAQEEGGEVDEDGIEVVKL